jgi:HAMP domain-containing protein
MIRSLLRFGEMILVLGLLFVLPALTIRYFAGFLDKSAQRQRFRSHQESLEKEFSALFQAISPEHYVHKRFKKLAAAAFHQGKSTPHLPQYVKFARTQWNMDFDVFVFDRQGKIQELPGFPLKNKFLMQALWNLLREEPSPAPRSPGSAQPPGQPAHASPPGEVGTGIWKNIQKQQQRFGALLGPEFLLSPIKASAGRTFLFQNRLRPHALFWKSFSRHNRSGILFLATRIPRRIDILRGIARRYRNEQRPLIMKEYHQNPVPLSLPRKQDGLKDWERITRELDQTTERFLRNEDQVWGRARLDNLTLYLVRHSPADSGHRREQAGNLLAAIWIVAGCLIIPWRTGSRFTPTLSIRWKLATVFAFVLFLPVTGSLQMGLQSLEDRQLLMEAEIFRQARETLAGFDFDFSLVTSTFEGASRRLRDSQELQQATQGLTDKVKETLGSDKRLHLEVRDIKGDLLFFHSYPGAANSLDSLFDGFGRLAIMKHLKPRLEKARETVNNPPDSFLEKFLFTNYFGFGAILSRNDLAHYPEVGNSRYFWYWDVIPDILPKTAYLLVFSPVADWCGHYLHQRLKHRTFPANGSFLIFARENATHQTLPKGIPVKGNLETLADRVKSGQEFVTGKGTYRGTPCLIVGMPGRWLDGYSLFALMPEAEITRQIRIQTTSLLRQLVLGLLFAGALGILLANAFLLPVGRIASGLAALRRRDISFRIPTSREDELGILADSFNHLLEDLKEMELAKVVQASMIPNDFPPIPGYSGVLKCETASRLGGDYCDILPLPDGDFLFVIGDVTGHGVGAALLVAMAKAVSTRAAVKSHSLPHLLRCLDDMICRLLKRNMLMTFLAMRFSPASGQMEFCNAGHPFPLIVSRDAKIREINLPHLPLGLFRMDPELPVVDVRLQPGETLVLHTDGFVEAKMSGREMVGRERFTSLVASASSQDLPGMFSGFWENWRRLCGNHPADDDCTMIMIRRHDIAPTCPGDSR